MRLRRRLDGESESAPMRTDFTRRARLLVAVALLALAMPACGFLGPATQVASPGPTATAAQSADSSGDGEPVAFTSSIYPYSLVLPPEAVRSGSWRPATQEWDGDQRIDSGGPLVDSVFADDGVLFLYGTPWTEDLQAFAERVHANGVEYHDCSVQPLSTDEAEIASAPSLIYTMECGGTSVIRVIMLHEGYGLVAAELLNVGVADPVRRLVERLGGLTWTNG